MSPDIPPARDLELVVFGATGFTGKFITKYVARTFAASAAGSWAVAGRSEARLRDLVKDVRDEAIKSGAGVPDALLADVSNPRSLAAMCARTKLVINAVGPFRFHGEPVVKACIENGADYVDITGEPEFFERMQCVYNDEAKRKGIMVVHCCGFDCVPADLSVLFAKRQLLAKGAVPSSIEMFLQLKTSSPRGITANFATYESAVHGMGSVEELRRLRKEVKRPRLTQIGPRLQLKNIVAWDDRVKSWIVPFFFADPSIIRLSQYLEAEFGARCTADGKPLPPVQFAGYIQVGSFLYVALFVVMLAVFSFLAARPWGRDLLLRHPRFFSYGLFSHDGPSEEQIRGTQFTSRFFAAGYSDERSAKAGGKPDVRLVTECAGPEPGYVTTSVCVVNCAYAILRNKETLKLPAGVLTPAVALGKTDIIERLSKEGVRFTVVS